MPPKMLSNKVNPLDWKVPIVDTSTGAPTPEFQRKWQQQAAANASITDLTTAAAVSAVIDLISSTVGALLVRGTNQWTGLVPVADGRVLRDKGVGATPIWDTISDILDTLGSVQGDVLYRDTAAWKVLAPGTAGQVLTTGGAAANPSWATSASGGGAVSSVNDDGTTFYLALMDADGQLILDGLGDPVFLPEVFPPAALPAATNSVQGAVLPDNVTLAVAAGLLGTKFCGFSANLASNQNVSNNVSTTVVYDTVVLDTLSAYSVLTGIFTPTKAGNWLIFWAMRGQVTTSMTLVQGILQKNGATSLQLINAGQLSSVLPNFSASIFAFTIVAMNGSTDNVRVKGSVNGTGGGNFFDGTGILNAFGAVYLGP